MPPLMVCDTVPIRSQIFTVIVADVLRLFSLPRCALEHALHERECPSAAIATVFVRIEASEFVGYILAGYVVVVRFAIVVQHYFTDLIFEILRQSVIVILFHNRYCFDVIIANILPTVSSWGGWYGRTVVGTDCCDQGERDNADPWYGYIAVRTFWPAVRGRVPDLRMDFWVCGSRKSSYRIADTVGSSQWELSANAAKFTTTDNVPV